MARVKEEGYHRCGTCNYCAVDSDDGRTVSYDRRDDQYICSLCQGIIGTTLSEYGFDDEKDNTTVANAQEGNSWRTQAKTGKQLLYERFGPDLKDRPRVQNPHGNNQHKKKVTLIKVTGLEDNSLDIENVKELVTENS